MSGHPVVEQAAVAVLCGMDPLRYLAYEDTERTVADAVLERANRLRADEMRQVAEVQAALTGNRIAEILAKAFKG